MKRLLLSLSPRLLWRLMVLLACLPLTTASAQTDIVFTLDNFQVTVSGGKEAAMSQRVMFYEFDVMVAAGVAGTALGPTLVLINYNTAGFGPSVDANGKITVTEGSLISDNSNYGVVVNDNTASTVAITGTYNPFDPNNGEVLPAAPQSLFHVMLEVAETSEGAVISFNQAAMQGQQFEDDLATAYAPVLASDTCSGGRGRASGARRTRCTPATGGDKTALPVELTRFEAMVDGDAVVLRWETASETNSAGLEVEWREGGEGGEAEAGAAWKPLGFVKGYGPMSAPQAYNYRVESLVPGVHRFRLKQIDFNGTFAYSPELEVTVEAPGEYLLSAPFPNPFNPQTTISLIVAHQQQVRVEIFDTLGRRVALLFNERLPAHHVREFVWHAATHPSGLYVIRVTGERFAEARPVVLLK